MSPGREDEGETVSPRAVLTDFGGVLTTSVVEAFRAWSRQTSGDPLLLERLFREDAEVGRLLVEHECGRLPEPEFERGLAERLRAHGVDVPGPGAGLVSGLATLMGPDAEMIAAVHRLRAGGVPVALVSNSLGDDCYNGFDLDALADVVVISAEVGVRKPSRRIYRIACERLGVEPAECVLIDDLPHNLDGAARLGITGLHHVESAATIATLDRMFGDHALNPTSTSP